MGCNLHLQVLKQFDKLTFKNPDGLRVKNWFFKKLLFRQNFIFLWQNVYFCIIRIALLDNEISLNPYFFRTLHTYLQYLFFRLKNWSQTEVFSTDTTSLAMGIITLLRSVALNALYVNFTSSFKVVEFFPKRKPKTSRPGLVLIYYDHIWGPYGYM